MRTEHTRDTESPHYNALNRQLALLLRGFSYNGRRAAGISRVASSVQIGSARPELILPGPEHAVDTEYRRTAAELWLNYQAEHGAPPDSVVVKDGAGAQRFVIAHSELADRVESFLGTGIDRGAGPGEPSQSVGVATSRADLMAGRVAIVTGGAQGFGLEIARELSIGGAMVVLADRNLEAAKQAARDLNQFSQTRYASAVGCDVSDEESVIELIESVVDTFGGFDLFISNAGVLRAGSVLDLPVEDFQLVTAVNYQAFFLCTKHAARALQAQNHAYRALNSVRQHRTAEQELELPAHFTTDIIQINSKSGLRGSNRNGAYAGSKFGAVGLVQSFALELVEHGIKVNAVCPGNFFDGPLWSDPENGLFVQYLNAGKVPGAKTVAEVKRHYESRVPMQRGCSGRDVARAIYYLVEQEYETGQALPVTGGQEMLH